MKHMIFMILLPVMLFAVDKQIIIGSFSDKANAINNEIALNHHIKNNLKFQKLVKKNVLHVENKKIEKYYVVALLPISTKVELFKTLEQVKTYYPKAYVLDAPQKTTILDDEVEAIAKKLQKANVEAPRIKKDKPVFKKKLILNRDIDDKVNYKEYIEYILVFLALMGLGFMLYIRKKS